MRGAYRSQDKGDDGDQGGIKHFFVVDRFIKDEKEDRKDSIASNEKMVVFSYL